MKNINWWKVVGISVIIILVFIYGHSCGRKSVLVKNGSDSTITYTRDSFIYVPSPPVQFPGKKIYLKAKPDTVWGDPEKETIYVPDNTPDWVLNDLRKYQAINIYDTVLQMKNMDSLFISDTLSQNRIIGRKILYTSWDTAIVESREIMQPKKIILYWSFYGNKLGVGSGIGLKTMNDWIYNIEYGTRKEITGRIFIPIRLNRKK